MGIKKLLLMTGFLITAISMGVNVWLVGKSQERQKYLANELENIATARTISAQYLFESNAAMQAAAQLYTANASMTGRPESGLRVNDLIVDSLNRTTTFSEAAINTLQSNTRRKEDGYHFQESCETNIGPVPDRLDGLVSRPGDSAECNRPDACGDSWACGSEVKDLLIEELERGQPNIKLLRCRYDQLRQTDHAFGVEWRKLDESALRRSTLFSCGLRQESARMDFLTSVLTVFSFLGIMIAFMKDLAAD